MANSQLRRAIKLEVPHVLPVKILILAVIKVLNPLILHLQLVLVFLKNFVVSLLSLILVSILANLDFFASVTEADLGFETVWYVARVDLEVSLLVVLNLPILLKLQRPIGGIWKLVVRVLRKLLVVEFECRKRVVFSQILCSGTYLCLVCIVWILLWHLEIHPIFLNFLEPIRPLRLRKIELIRLDLLSVSSLIHDIEA